LHGASTPSTGAGLCVEDVRHRYHAHPPRCINSKQLAGLNQGEEVMRVVLLLVVLAVAGVIGWKHRDEIPFLRDAARQVERVEVPKIRLGNDQPSTAGAQDRPAASSGAPRRCLVNGSVLYTNDACPAGSTEQKVKGGAVTVVPGYKAPVAPASAGSGIPNARELLAPKGGTLKEQAQERAMEGL